MKNILIITTMLFVISCTNKIDINGFNEEAWTHDKNGCEGLRYSMMEQLISIREQLKGLNTDEIISVLGRPDKTQLGERNQRYFIYSIAPAATCDSYSTDKVNTLSIRFNAIGLAYEVLIL